jgi:hypothetical protein
LLGPNHENPGIINHTGFAEVKGLKFMYDGCVVWFFYFAELSSTLEWGGYTANSSIG